MTQSNFYPRAAALTVALAILAACGGSGGGVLGIQSLGTVFQQAFGQDPNDAPLDVSDAGLEVQLTGEPFAL